MGSPNSGPFSYISGSLQLYTEALNFASGSSKLVRSDHANSKSDFYSVINKMEPSIKSQALRFMKKTSSSYKNFKYDIYENGLHTISAIKPGNVPGSYAEYVKIMYEDGTIRAMYKDTYVSEGTRLHRHIKWPMKEV